MQRIIRKINAFFKPPEPRWHYRPSTIETERRRRIRVAVFAYAYEIKSDPLISDTEFDKLCLKIKPKRRTGNKELDTWFRKNFSPYTGQWVINHPDRKGLNRIYKLWKNKWRRR